MVLFIFGGKVFLILYSEVGGSGFIESIGAFFVYPNEQYILDDCDFN
jgi:hypothetical protein